MSLEPAVEAHQQNEVDENLRAVRAVADRIASEMGVTVTATVVPDDAEVPPGCKKVHFIRHGEGHHNVVQREWRARAGWDGASEPYTLDTDPEYRFVDALLTEKGEAEAVKAAAGVDLGAKLDCPAAALSGGQRRKLSLASALLGDPAVVFLDEPTSGMDPHARRYTWDVIRRVAARSGSCVLLTTHFLDEADLLCDRVAIMSAGKLACVGSPVFLKNR